LENQNIKVSHFVLFFFLVKNISQKLLYLLRMLQSVPHINLDKVHLSTPKNLCMAPGTVNRQQEFEYQQSQMSLVSFFFKQSQPNMLKSKAIALSWDVTMYRHQ